MTRWLSPTGSLIIGTLENIPGIARLIDISDDGRIEYLGGTDILWDGQATVQRDGKSVFVDEGGDEWAFDQLVKAPADG
ncbi:hypothetical protein J2X65_003516 [Ancylobacter sp. 3268]|uniref:hypothetical protein n=1 Tax=Ancylobacter sp. 3268 TaxID=2817752 RepID=UPI002866E804|nr:hypothetical protein [Ancylobacter sp. 3268]MDR6954148.1 hypothetical protein [Ancylobacter sp. 3268]